MSQMLLWLFLVGVFSGIIGFNPVSGSVLPKKLIRSPLYPLKNLGNTKQQYPEFAFNQCLNHFTPNGCNQTWNQRYWVDDKHYVNDGPILLFLGGEADAETWMDAFNWEFYAEAYNGRRIVLEHRFYGKSYPVQNPTLDDFKNLHNTRQAVEDIATFIKGYETENNIQGVKWVLFGASYSAMIATWFKDRHPDLVTVVVQSSGPLTPQYDYKDSAEVTANVIKDVDEECYNIVKSTFTCIEGLVNGTGCAPYTSINAVLDKLSPCAPVDLADKLAAEQFFYKLILNWEGNWPYNATTRKCPLLKSFNGSDLLDNYGQYLEALSLTEFVWCSEESLPAMDDDLHNYMFQACNEFGYYMASDPRQGVFGYDSFSGEGWGQDCRRFFGPEYTKEFVEARIEETYAYHKKISDLDVRCVIFTNGGYDIWHPAGIIDPDMTNSNNTVFFTPHGEHCSELQRSQGSFEEEVAATRQKVFEQIGIYLNDPLCSPRK